MSIKKTIVKSLKPGSYFLIEDEPCRVISIEKSKPGKHGAAKARIVAIGVFDGSKRSIVKPVNANADVPLIEKKFGQIFSVTSQGVQIMDLETYEYIDTSLPEDEEIKNRLENGIEVEYWRILGRVKIVRIK